MPEDRAMNEHDTSPAPTAATRPPRRWPRRMLLWSAGVLALLLALLVAGGGGLWWALKDERGTAWLLSRLPGVQVSKPHGSFLGDFGADSVVWRFGDGGELRLVQVDWKHLAVARSSVPKAWARISFDTLHAREAHLTPPRREQTNRTPPPQQLTLPVELVIDALQVDALHATPLGDLPLTGLQARIHLGDDGGRVHRIDRLALARGPLTASGDLRVGAPAPMDSDIRIDLAQAAAGDLPAWNAALRV
jgi:translocation and assembly module TamB